MLYCWHLQKQMRCRVIQVSIVHVFTADMGSSVTGGRESIVDVSHTGDMDADEAEHEWTEGYGLMREPNAWHGILESSFVTSVTFSLYRSLSVEGDLFRVVLVVSASVDCIGDECFSTVFVAVAISVLLAMFVLLDLAEANASMHVFPWWPLFSRLWRRS